MTNADFKTMKKIAAKKAKRGLNQKRKHRASNMGSPVTSKSYAFGSPSGRLVPGFGLPKIDAAGFLNSLFSRP
ncbi:MAG: hypothetical protein KAR06_01370 [Deltaproteobacteria bacterium]|nr:hypothetical protein [Deltaproteobacteria bacterium]